MAAQADNERGENTAEGREKGSGWVIFGGIVSALWAIALGLYILHHGGWPGSLNEFGDFLSGAFAPLAFLWLFVAVMVQAQELSLQRRELRLTRREFSETRKVAKEQVSEVHRQAEIISTQTDVMRGEQRPWLSLGKPNIMVDDEGSAIRFEVRAKNLGRTPALSVEVHVEARRSQIVQPSVSEVEKYAAGFKGVGTWKNNHRVVFPDKSRPVEPSQSVQVLGGQTGQPIRVLYCVTYRSNSGGAVFRTAGEAVFGPSNVNPNYFSDDGFLPVGKFQFYGVGFVD
jgi:hypothetical protein